MIWLAGLFARWGVPESVRKPLGYAIAGLVLVALLWALWAIWLHSHDKAVVEKHEQAITRQVETKSSEAAASASAAVEQSRTETERTNDEARKAAADSDDPLRAGLDRLRQGNGADRPAAR